MCSETSKKVRTIVGVRETKGRAVKEAKGDDIPFVGLYVVNPYLGEHPREPATHVSRVLVAVT
jgi:hypothetical protein